MLDSDLFNLIVVFCESSIQVPPSLSFSSLDGRPRPISDCPSVRRLLDVVRGARNPSTSGDGEHKFTESFIICRIFTKMYNFREKIFTFSYVKINWEREISDLQKVVRESNVSVLTSHAGLNPRSCTVLSLTASIVSLYEAWSRTGTANYQKVAHDIFIYYALSSRI